MNDNEIRLDHSDAELAEMLGADIAEIQRSKAGFEFVDNVAQAIREARIAQGWTQKRLADQIGVTVGRISQYETGDLRHAPNLRTVAEIAHVLDMDVAFWLLPKIEAKDFPTEVSLSVGEAATMGFEVLADRLQNVAQEVVRRHPEMKPAPLLSERVREAMDEG